MEASKFEILYPNIGLFQYFNVNNQQNARTV